MIIKFLFSALVGSLVISCGTKDKIPGTYVREYSFKIIHPETGIEIGMRTIADTIFIQKSDDGYLVANNKWQKNDFDTEGWRNMEHMEDRPMASYITTFNEKTGDLGGGRHASLILDADCNSLYKEPYKDQIYNKAK